MMQKFIARERFEFPNGAIGWRSGPTGQTGSFDCLGPYAKVQNCPVDGTDLRRTCYATGYPDTFFSIPACTRVKGKYVGGCFILTSNGSITFYPSVKYREALHAQN